MADRRLKAWEKEKKLIPVMIKKYCRGRHKAERKSQRIKRGGVCDECQELTEFALFRLEKCPFKVNKKFCSFCKIHCYKPEMREKIKAVMKYSGPRMLFTHPVFAISHVVQMIKYKKQLKRSVKTMIELTIEVEGMKCGMCESHVNDVVRRVEGVKKVSSSHSKNQTVVVAEDGVNQEEIVKAISAQGYGVGGTEVKPYVKRGLFGRKQ